MAVETQGFPQEMIYKWSFYIAMLVLWKVDYHLLIHTSKFFGHLSFSVPPWVWHTQNSRTLPLEPPEKALVEEPRCCFHVRNEWLTHFKSGSIGILKENSPTLSSLPSVLCIQSPCCGRIWRSKAVTKAWHAIGGWSFWWAFMIYVIWLENVGELYHVVDPSPPTTNKEIQGICILKAPCRAIENINITTDGLPTSSQHVPRHQPTWPKGSGKKNVLATSLWTSQTYQGAFAGEFTHGKWLPGITWC